MKIRIFSITLISLFVLAGCGDYETASSNIPPVAKAGENQTLKESRDVVLNASLSSDVDGSIVGYIWKEGDTTLSTSESFSKSDFTVGKHTLILTVTDNNKETNSDTVEINIIANVAPIAKAGENQTLTEGDTVALNGSSSSDSDGTIVSYIWQEGETILSNSATFSKSDFTVGKHTITLSVIDNDGAADTDILLLTITEVPNIAPTADAGSNQVVTKGNVVTLNASSSSDSDGSIVGYLWSEGNTALSANAIFSKSDFSLGIHTITLSVIDNDGAADTDILLLTITEVPNIAPMAYAGEDQSIVEGNSVTLNASSSNDSDGFIVGYLWKDGDTELSTSGIFSKSDFLIGTHIITLMVTDNDGSINSDTIIITVETTHNGIRYSTVKSPYTGKIWLDRNLGASRVCTAFDDSQCYGNYYQWGRDEDGHEKSNSRTTSTQATDINSAGSKFITSSSDYDYDWAKDADSDGSLRSWNWSKTDGTSICPVGYRVPTIDELKEERLDEGEDAYSNFLKFPSAGNRGSDSGSVYGQGSWGGVWSSSVSGSYSSYLRFGSDLPGSSYSYHASGFSVRCVRD